MRCGLATDSDPAKASQPRHRDGGVRLGRHDTVAHRDVPEPYGLRCRGTLRSMRPALQNQQVVECTRTHQSGNTLGPDQMVGA